MTRDVLLVLLDIVFVAGVSIGVGATAPRWPDAWLDRDPFPLRLAPWESVRWYRRVGVSRLAGWLPELGATFGGRSKSALPGRSRVDLVGYVREVRRAEWVHWISMATPIVLFAVNPWWLALAFLIVVIGVNAPFILILRNNRLRILRILERHPA